MSNTISELAVMYKEQAQFVTVANHKGTAQVTLDIGQQHLKQPSLYHNHLHIVLPEITNNFRQNNVPPTAGERKQKQIIKIEI